MPLMQQPTRGRVRPGLLLLTLLLTPPAVKAQMPADEVFKDFRLNGEFVFELDGEVLEHAEVYFSDRAVAYLVMAPELASPLMISPRTQAVESLHLMKVYKKNDGTVDLLADAVFDRVGPFQLQDKQVVFDLGGKSARLKPRPWLLGRQAGEGLKEHDPEYALRASQYRPGAQVLEALRQQQKNVRVVVYFGSWCPACKRQVPKVLRVDDELAGSRVRFDYYGLPQPIPDDPEAERAGIHGVPTAVVFVDGKEAGRLSGNELEAPEASIRRLLGAS